MHPVPQAPFWTNPLTEGEHTLVYRYPLDVLRDLANGAEDQQRRDRQLGGEREKAERPAKRQLDVLDQDLVGG